MTRLYAIILAAVLAKMSAPIIVRATNRAVSEYRAAAREFSACALAGMEVGVDAILDGDESWPEKAVNAALSAPLAR